MCMMTMDACHATILIPSHSSGATSSILIPSHSSGVTSSPSSGNEMIYSGYEVTPQKCGYFGKPIRGGIDQIGWTLFTGPLQVMLERD